MKIKKEKIIHNLGYIKLKITFNNCFLTLTDGEGNVLANTHIGVFKFKGSKQRSPYAANVIVETLVSKLKKLNIEIKLLILQINTYAKTPFVKNVVKTFKKLNINNIFYVQYLQRKAHNGIRLKRRRRL